MHHGSWRPCCLEESLGNHGGPSTSQGLLRNGQVFTGLTQCFPSGTFCVAIGHHRGETHRARTEVVGETGN